MGIVHIRIPKQLTKTIQSAFEINCLVETGTNDGETAVWAANFFDNVITIECSKAIYQHTVKKYSYLDNIEFICGNSKQEIKNIIPQLNGSTFFWLDAHWSGGITHGEDDECPLLDELKAINNSGYQHFILIDDASTFTSPPPLPHQVENWPNIGKIVDLLNSGTYPRYIVIIEDIIIAVPLTAKNLISSFCQRVNTEIINIPHRNINLTSDLSTIALYFTKTGQYEDAVSLYEEILQVQPTSWETYCYLGVALIGDNRESEAELSWSLGLANTEETSPEPRLNKLLAILTEFYELELKYNNHRLANKISQKIASLSE